MWTTIGVASAIQNCQLRKSVLVILVEPPQNVPAKRSVESETKKEMLSRIATSSMHRLTFAHDAVTTVIRDSQAMCLKFPSDDSNADFKAFSVYFKAHGMLPNLYFISPSTGQTLVNKTGFVSPKAFVASLVATTKSVSGRVLNIPEIEPTPSATAIPTTLPTLTNPVDENLERGDQNNAVGAGAQSPAKPTTITAVDENITTSVVGSRSAPSQTSKPSIAALPTASNSMKLPGGTRTESGEEARLLARLPGGAQARKNFPGTTRFSVVRSWLSEEVKSPANAMVISTAFPRRVFDLGEDPKMLLELGLVPSETLIVAVIGKKTDHIPQGQAANEQSLGIRSYAAGALGIVGGFFRSFVADGPTAAPTGQETTQAPFTNATPRGETREQVPSAMQIDRPRPNRPEVDDDENLLSNGNSTQYGWNPTDEEDSRS